MLSYLLGVLNSRLFVFLYRLISLEKGRVLAQVKPSLIANLPIKKIDFDDLREKNIHQKINESVGLMTKLKKNINLLPSCSKKEKMAREIQITDEKIDKLVYELYGITEEEKKIIEEGI